MGGRFYIDSSAYLCLLLGERRSLPLASELAEGLLLSSALLVLEVNRNLIRLSRAGALPPPKLQDCLERFYQDCERFQLRDLTIDLCQGLSIPVVSTPRSLDLVHLRTALWFHQTEPLTRFVSLDEPQIQSARELGLPT